MEYDILGDNDFYDIEGDYLGDDYYDVGISLQDVLQPHRMLTSRNLTRARRGLASAIMPGGGKRRRRRGRSGAVVRAKKPGNAKTMVLNVDSGTTLIAAGASQTITVQPSNVFRPIRFVVDSVGAPNFFIDDIKVGRSSQFLNGSSAPATIFSAGAVGVMVDWDTLQVSQQLAVTVTNADTASHRFMASLIGTTLE